MAGYCAGVVQAPMTAFVIVLEMTGDHDNLIALMCAAMLGLRDCPPHFARATLSCDVPGVHCRGNQEAAGGIGRCRLGCLGASEPPSQSGGSKSHTDKMMATAAGNAIKSAIFSDLLMAGAQSRRSD